MIFLFNYCRWFWGFILIFQGCKLSKMNYVIPNRIERTPSPNHSQSFGPQKFTCFLTGHAFLHHQFQSQNIPVCSSFASCACWDIAVAMNGAFQSPGGKTNTPTNINSADPMAMGVLARLLTSDQLWFLMDASWLPHTFDYSWWCAIPLQKCFKIMPGMGSTTNMNNWINIYSPKKQTAGTITYR